MKKVEYDLGEKNKLYFFPEYNRFTFNDPAPEMVADYYSDSLVKLRLEISHLCNGRCKYCLVYGNNVEKAEILDVKQFWKHLVSQEWFKNIKKIFIIGGEPLLHFEEISYIIDNFNGKISFSTNGTLITKDMAKKFSKSNVKVYISLDGPEFEDNINRVYINQEFMYPDIIRGINLLKEYNVKFGIFMVATPETVKKATNMILKLDEKYSPIRIGYNLPHWTPDYENSGLAEEFRDVLLELYRNRKKLKAEIPQLKWRLNPLCEGKIKKFSCGLHTTQTTILPDKSIIRCSKIDNENDNLKLCVTNELLDKNSPIELAKDKKSNCSKCIALSCCGGGCPFDGMKRFNCLTDRRECVITPPLVNIAINNVVEKFKSQEIKVPNGLIKPDIINKLIWS